MRSIAECRVGGCPLPPAVLSADEAADVRAALGEDPAAEFRSATAPAAAPLAAEAAAAAPAPSAVQQGRRLLQGARAGRKLRQELLTQDGGAMDPLVAAGGVDPAADLTAQGGWLWLWLPAAPSADTDSLPPLCAPCCVGGLAACPRGSRLMGAAGLASSCTGTSITTVGGELPMPQVDPSKLADAGHAAAAVPTRVCRWPSGRFVGWPGWLAIVRCVPLCSLLLSFHLSSRRLAAGALPELTDVLSNAYTGDFLTEGWAIRWGLGGRRAGRVRAGGMAQLCSCVIH